MEDRAILWTECCEEAVSFECFEGQLSKQAKTVDDLCKVLQGSEKKKRIEITARL